MLVRYELCDHCKLAGTADEMTVIHLEKNGRPFTYRFHNRNPEDCLAQKLRLLKRQFAGQ
ncbi:MAG: hypothetical protein WBW84_15745 [Acidobacteriaceae bacterium]